MSYTREIEEGKGFGWFEPAHS